MACAGASKRAGRPSRRTSPLSRPALAAALTALVAVAVAVPLAVSRGGHHPERVSGAAVGEAHSGGAKSAGPALAGPEEPALRGDEKAAGAGANAAAAPSSAAAAGSRRVERTATLDVGVAPGSIESTSQQVFTLASSVGGYVRQSNVSSGAPGQSGASFDVRIPSSSVSRAIAELSQLGHVRSENDTTNDVTEQFNSLRDLLGTLQAERASLLRRLASASAPQQEAALKARVQYVQRRISQLQRELSGLRTRVDYTSLALTLTAETPPGAKQGNLTPGGAARAAGQILETALAVLVIGVAALFPLVAVALVAWLAIISSRRRLREHALDAS